MKCALAPVPTAAEQNYGHGYANTPRKGGDALIQTPPYAVSQTPQTSTVKPLPLSSTLKILMCPAGIPKPLAPWLKVLGNR